MRKNPTSKSGIFNPRILFAFALCSFGVLLAMLSFGATPGETKGSNTSLPADPLHLQNSPSATPLMLTLSGPASVVQGSPRTYQGMLDLEGSGIGGQTVELLLDEEPIAT